MRIILASLFVTLMLISTAWIVFTLIEYGPIGGFASDLAISLALVLWAVVVAPLGLLIGEPRFDQQPDQVLSR